MINSDGTGLIQLTTNDVSDTRPSISFDGAKIAFFSDLDGDYEVFVVNSDGTGLSQLTSNTASDIFPSISGDGSKIAFQSNVDGDYEIFAIYASAHLTIGEPIGSGSTSPDVGFYIYAKGTVAEVTATPDPGWRFDHWGWWSWLKIIFAGTDNPISITMDANKGTLVAIFEEDPMFDLNLEAGWNMLSFPCIPDDAGFSSIFEDIGFYQVLTWDGSSYVTPTEAEAGVGYWVLVLEETTISLVDANPVMSYTKTLPAGWSMIGSIYDQTVDADDVFPGFYQLLTWDGSSYVTSTTIEPGKGYWALVLEQTTITVG